MSGFICPSVTPDIERLYKEIEKLYPEASKRENLTADKVAEWVGIYNTKNNKTLDFIPGARELVNNIEKWRNTEGKSFLNDSDLDKSGNDNFDSSLTVNDSRTARFNRTFTPQQVKDRGAMIADKFSDILDEALEDEVDRQRDIIDSNTASEAEKDAAKTKVKELRDPVNGRQLIAREIGIENIIKQIKSQLQKDLERGREGGMYEKQVIALENTIEYFKELFNTQATLDIEDREGIRIVGLEIREDNPEEENNTAIDNGDDDTGHIASGSDGWSFQVRFEDPFNSLSRKVKGILYDVRRPESEKDDFGYVRRYSTGQIYASLISFLSKNVQSADDFLQVERNLSGRETDAHGAVINDENYPNGYPTFPALEKMKVQYPWVEQIIQRLTDDYARPDLYNDLRYPSTGGSLASQFYTNFRKAYIPYAKIQIGEKNFGVTPLNYEMADRVQYNKLVANYNNRLVLTPMSIYDTNGRINKDNIPALKDAINKVQRRIKSLGDIAEKINDEKQAQYINPVIEEARNVLQSFGIDATQEGVSSYLAAKDGSNDYSELEGMLFDLQHILNRIKSSVGNSNIDTYNYISDTVDNNGNKLWTHFFDGRGFISDDTYMQSYYDSASKKTKYSYSADNYLMKTFRGVAFGTQAERRAFIDDHFGKFEWFKNQKTGEWRNKWLEFWYNFPHDVDRLPYRNIDNISEYREDKTTVVRPYSKWTKADIWQVQNRNYDAEKESDTSFYLSPIFSDSPMSMTVRGPRMNLQQLLYGYTDKANVRHQGALIQLVNQELWRIQQTQKRAEAMKENKSIKPIANFDDNKDKGFCGFRFCFFPELNDYTFENGEKFLDRMIRLKKDKASLSQIEAAEIQAIKEIADRKLNDYVIENKDHYTGELEEASLREQYYNMVYANAAIIQLTTVDLAFYKDATDFQKRFKEVYAGGIQLNTNSKYGKKTENVVMVSDDIITSPSYDKIAAIIDGAANLTKKEKESIKEKFLDINVADAQAIRSMHSFRSVLDMMGRWDDSMEQALNHFKEGTWSREDFDVVYQVIKPFVYSVIERNDGLGNTMLVPQQNKNSEICALMMYDLITNGLDNSPVYKGLSMFMENTKGSDDDYLIDMIQFESAGKVGNQGVINISFNPEKVVSLIDNGFTIGNTEYTFYPAEKNSKVTINNIEGAEENYRAIKKQLDKQLTSGNMSQTDHDKIIDYLRPTAEEIADILSQRVLVSNPDGSKAINTEVVHTIPFENYYQQQPTPEHHIDAQATFGSQARNINVADLPENFEITVEGKDGEQKIIKGGDAVVDFYYELLDENLIEDFFGKGSNKGLKGLFESKESLRDAVTEIVRGNSKYGRDFADAMQIVDGDFVLSPNSPTMFTLMQEIMTSFFKNRITKQTIDGAALIQAAGIGLDDNLRVLFDDNGKLLGAECYMPLTTRKFFEPLLKTQIKTINGEDREVKVLDPELLKRLGIDKAVGYRIPTENKSSMMPLIIKDFTPLQNGSTIVLPAEVTTMAGSDFDVDKMFVMLTAFEVQEYKMKKAREDYAKENKQFKELLSTFTHSELAGNLLESEPEDFKQWFDKNKDNYKLKSPVIRKIEYNFNKEPKDNSRKARNNMVIQIMYNILTSKAGSESLFNPQGFEDVERAAKMAKIMTDETLRGVLERQFEGDTEAMTNYLLTSSKKTLKDFIDNNSAADSPIYPQTFAKLHAQNMAGSNQIGIYAIQGSMAAKFQRADIRLRENEKILLNGRTVDRVDVSDNGKRLKNVGQMIGASADNGKNPNLTDMGSTDVTAPIIGYMLRLGFSHDEAALIINQPSMKRAKYRASNFSSPQGNVWELKKGDVTSKMLVENILDSEGMLDNEVSAIDWLCYHILTQYEAMEYLTQVSRADSPNGSIKNSYAKARIQQYKVDLLQAKMGQRNFPFMKIQEALSNTAIDITKGPDAVREDLKNQKMGLLHAFYALGINSFDKLIKPYFFGADKNFDDKIVKPILYNLNERMADDKKAEVVNNIYTSYITFILSGSPKLGNSSDRSMKAKRDYYLKQFPSDYLKTIQDNKDIREILGNILQVKQDGSRRRIVLQDVGSLSKGQKADVQRRFESLFYSDNPKAKNLAEDLLIYSYYDNGLKFTHDSFSHLFTTGYLLNFPTYADTLKTLDRKLTDEEYNNFIIQFLLTYPDVAYKADGIVKEKEHVSDNGNTITIDLNDSNIRKKMVNDVMSPNPLLEGVNVYPYISYNDELYILDQEKFDETPGRPVYHLVSKYATFPKLPLFNMEMSPSQMAEEFPWTQEEEKMAEGPSIEELYDEDLPAAPSMPEEDPFVSESLFNTVEEMPEFATPDPEVVNFAQQESKEDQYKNEGESEMQDPMCSK